MSMQHMSIGDNSLTLFVADTFLLRLRGLLGRSFDSFDALLLMPCRSIHMIGMKYPIDAVFLDPFGKVLKVAHGIKPGTLYVGHSKAISVIELPAGRAMDLGIICGKTLFFS